MRVVPVICADFVERVVLAGVAEAFGKCYTLSALMRWCAEQEPRVEILEIVTQDEYTHDLVVPFGAAFLSFDTA
jgi:hypothetical protein